MRPLEGVQVMPWSRWLAPSPDWTFDSDPFLRKSVTSWNPPIYLLIISDLCLTVFCALRNRTETFSVFSPLTQSLPQRVTSSQLRSGKSDACAAMFPYRHPTVIWLNPERALVKVTVFRFRQTYLNLKERKKNQLINPKKNTLEKFATGSNRIHEIHL